MFEERGNGTHLSTSGRTHVPSKRGKEIENRKGEATSHESTKMIDVILESSGCAWDGMKQCWKSETGVSEGVVSRNFLH
jgi:hypothetical protein